MIKIDTTEYREQLVKTQSFGQWLKEGRDKTWRPRGASGPMMIIAHVAIFGQTSPKAYTDWKHRNAPEAFATAGQARAFQQLKGNTMTDSASMAKLTLAGFLNRYQEGRLVSYRPGPRFNELLQQLQGTILNDKLNILELMELRLKTEG